MLAILGLFAAPYFVGPDTTPWRYVLADVAIGFVAALAFGRAALGRLGLTIPLRHLAAAAIAFAAVVAVAHPAVSHIAAAQQLQILEPRTAFSLSQVLHQEIVLRAVLLSLLARWIASRAVVCGAGAAIFAAAHAALYGLVEGSAMTVVTLATLAIFALAANLLFMEFRHIGFSFAAHAGWNVSRFGGAYLLAGRPVSEFQSFALIEGSPTALAIAVALFTVAVATSLLQARTRAAAGRSADAPD